MKRFIKLNIFAFLYGFVFFIQTELMVNVYIIKRIAHWFTNMSGIILSLCIFILSTIAYLFLTNRYLNTGKLRYFLTILWIPYYIGLVFLMPVIDRADEPPPVLGLIIIGIFIAYPFYIALINALCTKTNNTGTE